MNETYRDKRTACVNIKYVDVKPLDKKTKYAGNIP